MVPRTVCDCHPVSAIICAIEAPAVCRSSAMSRACLLTPTGATIEGFATAGGADFAVCLFAALWLADARGVTFFGLDFVAEGCGFTLLFRLDDLVLMGSPG